MIGTCGLIFPPQAIEGSSMSTVHPWRRVVVVALWLFVASAAGAAEPVSQTSLNKVPADAETYVSFLRMGETIETIAKSRAWLMIWNDPMVRELWKKAHEGFDAADEKTAPFKKFLADPANKELPALLADAFANEAFVYTSGLSDLAALAQESILGFRSFNLLQNLKEGDDADRARTRAILAFLAKKPEQLRLPDLVFGFKVSEPAKVTAQLKRLDAIVADALKETPLKGRSERISVDSDEFLTLKLDGALVPWEEIPIDKYEDKPGEFAALLKHLKKMKFNVAVGVRQGYLLLALGGSDDLLKKFGGEGPKLAERPEFKPMAKYSGKPFTSISYTSAKLRQATATSAQDIEGMAVLAKEMLKKLELEEKVELAIGKDVDALAKRIAKGIKKPGAEASFSFRTSQGWETFAYDFTEPDKKQTARPLTLMNHLGGDPLMAAVWRSDTTVEGYRDFVKWLSIFSKHVESAVAAKVPGSEEMVKKFRTEVVPLLTEISDITEKLWLPALADGQEGFVLDAKWTSKRWHGLMPEAETKLPMLEIGVVLGVSDAEKFQQALDGYRQVANKMMRKAQGELPAGTIPDFEIGKPQVETKEGRTFAHYPIPAELGVDPQFQPTGGLSKNVAALTLSRGHAERLLNDVPLKIKSAVLADSKRSLDSFFYFNWAGCVDVASKWSDYLFKSGLAPEEAAQTTRRALDFLKVFHGYASATYRENGATITHSEAVFRDIPAKSD
jgi:hypothetical protein